MHIIGHTVQVYYNTVDHSFVGGVSPAKWKYSTHCTRPLALDKGLRAPPRIVYVYSARIRTRTGYRAPYQYYSGSNTVRTAVGLAFGQRRACFLLYERSCPGSGSSGWLPTVLQYSYLGLGLSPRTRSYK